MSYNNNVMGLLSKSRLQPEYRISSDDAKRDRDGFLVCPRCESSDRAELATFTVSGETQIRREIRCWNCGRITKLADGVLYHRD